VEAARSATSIDPRTRAILQFAAAINIRRGAVSADTFAEAREAGVTDVELVEIVGHVVVNVLTNYLAKASGVHADVPEEASDDDAA
jgi:alkylhydroperoxidase family enzyme